MSIADAGYRYLARPILFRFGGGDAETAHRRTLAMLGRIQRHPALLRGLARLFAVDTAPRQLFGLTFPNPVGLAAGADKDGVALAAWPALGFGFVEAGTVTAVAQAGNPRPRVFRLVDSEAVINRMGFPNEGAAALARRLAAAGSIGVPLGISLGKSKVTSLGDATDDYVTSLRAVHDHADYVAVNVSSPNTPGLRGLQDRAALDDLVAALVVEARALARERERRLGDDHHDDGDRRVTDGGDRGANSSRRRGEAPVPLLVKIAPDLSDHAIGEVLEVCEQRGVAGMIATNTTVARPEIASSDRGLALEQGGLSGMPLTARTLQVVRFVAAHTDLPVVGVGGITSPEDGLRLLDAGASLLQLYTGLLYRGPGLVRALAHAAARRPSDPHAAPREAESP